MSGFSLIIEEIHYLRIHHVSCFVLFCYTCTCTCTYGGKIFLYGENPACMAHHYVLCSTRACARHVTVLECMTLCVVVVVMGVCGVTVCLRL